MAKELVKMFVKIVIQERGHWLECVMIALPANIQTSEHDCVNRVVLVKVNKRSVSHPATIARQVVTVLLGRHRVVHVLLVLTPLTTVHVSIVWLVNIVGWMTQKTTVSLAPLV
jgi:hypothetical protein